MIKKPMLASPLQIEDAASLSSVSFPMYASIKLDGIRAISSNGKLLSRTLKEIPNRHIQHMCRDLPSNLDGELMIDGMSFSDITSIVMSANEVSDFKFYIFDYVKNDSKTPYSQRLQDLISLKRDGKLPNFCVVVEQHLIHSVDDLLSFEEKVLSAGHEGVMLRSPSSPYKHGRSTLREGYLLKVKRFEHGEAKVIDVEEMMNNNNAPEVDLLGNTKRSHSKLGLTPAGTMGALVVIDLKTGSTFRIGSGFDMAMRDKIWTNKSEYIDKIVRYKYQAVGTKDSPRIPVFDGFRDESDM